MLHELLIKEKLERSQVPKESIRNKNKTVSNLGNKNLETLERDLERREMKMEVCGFLCVEFGSCDLDNYLHFIRRVSVHQANYTYTYTHTYTHMHTHQGWGGGYSGKVS